MKWALRLCNYDYDKILDLTEFKDLIDYLANKGWFLEFKKQELGWAILFVKEEQSKK